MNRGMITRALRNAGIPQVRLTPELPTVGGSLWTSPDNEAPVLLEPTSTGWLACYNDSTVIGRVKSFEGARAAIDLLEFGATVGQVNETLGNLDLIVEPFEEES
jgi:hypothetical protein